MAVDLFDDKCLIGMFKGFAEEGLEFRAEIVSPYNPDEDLTPRIGQFLLVELSSTTEAALGRITRFSPVGLMADREGDEYLAEMHRARSAVPAELKERRLRYSVKIRLLGGITSGHGPDGKLAFVPTARRLPHLGARVAVPSEDVLRFLCSLSATTPEAAPIGDYALGELVYNGGGPTGVEYIEARSPHLEVTFDVHSLMARRTFIFARAGYGKSNMLKLLLAQLYTNGAPKDTAGRPVGVLVLDPEGEYFWPDERDRPGLSNVSHLKDHLAVFTDRRAPNIYYESWKVGGVRLDLRDLKPADVVALCVSTDRQEQQNINKLRSLPQERWRRMVDYVAEHGHNAEPDTIAALTGLNNLSEVEASAMRSNLTAILNRLHDPDGTLQNNLLDLLREGMTVVVDLSLLSTQASLQVSGLLLKQIFDHNQRSFTNAASAEAGVVPTIAVLEEAQSVLGPRSDDESPFVAWAKEGRKYGLGAVMVTQQPGSISPQLLSQGDNFFTFHLLSAHDLKTLQHHNAHFSDDILAGVMNEPIAGNCYFWSAPYQPFVLPVRISDFSQTATDMPTDPAVLNAPAGVRAEKLDTEAAAAAEALQTAVSEAISPAAGRGVKFYQLPETARSQHPGSVACYRPELAAVAANYLPDGLHAKFANRGRGGTWYVSDQSLSEALTGLGISDGLQTVRAVRDDKLGDYCILPQDLIPADATLIAGLRTAD